VVNSPKVLSQISRRLRSLAARAVIRLVRDGLKEQGVQLQLLDAELGDAERYQHYGFTSHPHPGAEAIVLSLGGSRDHLVTIADGDRRYRFMNTAPGEVALYTDEGDNIHMQRGRIVEVNTQTMRINADTLVEINTATMQVNADTLCEINTATNQINAETACNIDAPLTAATGAVQAGLDITDRTVLAGGGTINGLRSTYNGHHHNETGTVTAVPNQQM